MLSGLPAAPVAAFAGGWSWEDWAILAATLIALALFLFLLFLLLCLLCPPGFCCRGASACCGKDRHEKKKLGLSSSQAVEMSSFGGSESNLTAVDLKLPRAWMDVSKSDFTDDRDAGIGLGSFGNQKTWSSNIAADGASRGVGKRSANMENYQGSLARSTNSWAEHGHHSAAEYADDSAKLDYYRSQSATTVMSPKNTGKIRDIMQEWERKSGGVTRKLEESRQARNKDVEEMKGKSSEWSDESFDRGKTRQEMSRRLGRTAEESRQTSNKDMEERRTKSFEWNEESFDRKNAVQEMNRRHSIHEESSRREMSKEEMTEASNMALVKRSAFGSASALTSHNGSGSPVLQCYTVTKKTTTTTYGNEEGEEETSVVTTTEKKWREGMNEVGEIAILASASAGELLPSIGAPAQVLNDVSNVHTVKSLTNVEGSVSNVVRRYEFEQTRHDADTLL